MRAIAITEPNRSDNIVLIDAANPVAGSGQVMIDVSYAGCNWGDFMLVQGTYPHPTIYPFVPGWEVSGRIAQVGRGVAGLKIGDRVAAYLPDGGGYAERSVALAVDIMELPDAVSLADGAAFPVQALTAWHMLHTVGKVAPGETVLIHAIGGGVGLWATQFAVAAGASMIGTVGTAGKERRALEYGAARVVNHTDEDFVAAVLDFTAEVGVDLVLDSLGATTLDRSFNIVRPLGRVISIGEAEGKPLATLWSHLVPRSLSFSRFHLGHVARPSAAWREGVDAVMSGLADQQFHAPVERVDPLEDAATALAALRSRGVPGKVLLRIRD